jgi:hypothetical protein
MSDNKKTKIATVYQVDYRSKMRLNVGSLVERRQTERGNNQKDLLLLARERFASNPNEALNIYIVCFFIDKEADAEASMQVHSTRGEAVKEPAIRLRNG